MNNITLSDIAAASRGTFVGKEKEQKRKIKNISIDSRKIEEGALFIPIKGERVDGHDFIMKALKNGAVCTLSVRELSKEARPYILVDSTLQAIKDIAEFYRESLNIKIVGVTGSVGKTSTKEIIASVLSQKYNVLKTKGNFNNEIGLPLTIFSIKEEHQVAVVEMGISGFGEMHRLSKIAKPDICVITNIGYSHLENLKSREGILKAKSEMFDFISDEGRIVLNGDDELLSGIKEVRQIKPIFYGINPKNDIVAENIKSNGLQGVSCTLKGKGGSINVEIPLPGNHMVYNAMAAMAVGKILNLEDEQIKNGIATIEVLSGRSNIIETDFITVIDDCYNANPISMKASLDVLSYAPDRKVCILGDMFELGNDEKQLHFDIGRYAAQKNIDLIICIGRLAKHMYDGAASIAGSSLKVHFNKKEDFLKNLSKLIKLNDTILIKASHGMKFDEIRKILVENKRTV